jgi:hypothetical protein
MTMPPLPTVFGARAIGEFFHRLCDGGTTHMRDVRVVPTRANGRPAVAMRRRRGDTWNPLGVLVLVVEGSRIGRLDTFLDPSLVPAFEERASRE